MGTLGNIGSVRKKNQNPATDKDKKENKIKPSILFSCIWPQGRETYNTFAFSQEGKSFDYNGIVRKFENVCIPRQNITLLRYKFFSYKRKEGQRFDEFMTQLRKLTICSAPICNL